ncbi:MAG: hypothetical protein ACU837_11275 [Gammaproteobacteria bacterium]
MLQFPIKLAVASKDDIAVNEHFGTEYITVWVENHPLSPLQVDCAVAVMLKILDGKCKMRPDEKLVMTLLYDQIKDQSGQLLSGELHPLIAAARKRSDDEALKMQVYEQRLLAETAISRPVMKQFKAFIREQGLFEDTETKDDTQEIDG